MTWIPAKEAAKMLGLNREYLRQRVISGHLNITRVRPTPKKVLYSAKDIHSIINQTSNR